MATTSDSPVVRDLLDFIREVCALPERLAGSESERMSQALLAGRIQDLGIDAIVEGAVCPPRPYAILALHAGSFLIAVALLAVAPWWSAVVAVVTAISFWGELRGSPRILRGLLLRRISGNMVARLYARDAAGEVVEKPGARVVLLAHADVASASALFHPVLKRIVRPSEELGHALHPGSIVLLAGAAQALAAFLWAIGLRGVVPLIPLVIAVVIHLGTLALAIDWWRSPPVEGAIDNASGLAVLLGVAQDLADAPLRQTEVWFVATGDREPDSGGVAAFLFQFRSLLDTETTLFVNIDDVGVGQLQVVTSEGRWERLPYRPTLPGIGERLTERPQFRDVGMMQLVGTTDAGPPTRAGYRAVTLTSFVDGARPDILHTPRDRPDAVEPAALALALDFTLAMIDEVEARLSRAGVG